MVSLSSHDCILGGQYFFKVNISWFPWLFSNSNNSQTRAPPSQLFYPCIYNPLWTSLLWTCLCPLKQISIFSKHLHKSNKNYVVKKLGHYFPTANYIYIKCMEGQKRTADLNTFDLLKQTTYLNYKKDSLTQEFLRNFAKPQMWDFILQ